MTEQDQAFEQWFASLTPEQRAKFEADSLANQEALTKVPEITEEKLVAVRKMLAEQDAEEAALYDVRQDGKLNDPRDLGPVGGSHVEG